ncbi:hypothetical protein VTK73DRAFT_8473 [Phialemonium thermophilum]|uniref:Uncharacterized protein n=1 Tax=Phialemonium thermophilum TaxID=223376 RepID=A0ABR3W8A5_9PEZI
MESQVLTERQKEVRERQKENAALFPEIRSSSPTKRAKAPSVRSASRPSSSSSAVQPHRRAATPPDAERSFDQFVASTPTPRRGQLVSLPDQDQDQDTDMADPPSSPPEPRRAPLFADFQTRSASSSIMDDWQFSSSPVSGSPANARHAAELPQLSADDGDEDADRVMADADETPTKAHRSDQQETGEPSSAFEEEEDVVQDSVLPEAPAAKEEEEVAPLLSTSTSEGAPQAIPSTPWRRDDQHPAAPRSDVGDVYRTALTSPHERRSQRALRSSAGRSEQNDTPAREDESPEHSASSLLVVELDSGRLDSAEYRQLTVSPDKRAAAARVDSGADDGALDCIVVGESPRLSKQQAKRPTTPVGTAAAAVSVGGGSFTGGSQTRSGSGRRRRRGGPPSSSRKKRKFREVEEQAGQEEEHSQSAAVASNSGSEGIRLRNGRVAKKKKRGGSQIASQPMSSQLSEEATSSSMGGPTQEDTSIVEETEMMDAAAVEDPDLEVQSQLAMEAQYQSARNQSSEPAEQQEQQEEQKEEEEERAVAQPQPAAKRSGPFQAIMSALQSGLETLRTAALSRQEVFKVEDMFMDLRRELYESERRGRA